jgi:hypothetical protein
MGVFPSLQYAYPVRPLLVMLLKGKQMLTIDTCSNNDADRLLGLADQFLDDWAEDAVQGGKSTEWKVIRPPLVSAPTMFKGLKEIAHICEGSSDPVAIRCAALARTALDGFLIAERT